jgi:hypothetical protein
MASEVVKMEPTKSGGKASNKRQKFVEFAEKRTVNAIKAIRVLAKLGNKAAYEYTEADVKKIVKALNAEIEALQTRMKATGRVDSVDFKL